MASEGLEGLPVGLWAWLCDACGQELIGPHDTCNSGYHVGPGGGNLGKAVYSGALVDQRDAALARLDAAETERDTARNYIASLHSAKSYEQMVAMEARLAATKTMLREVVEQFNLWSEDANDGTYAYYRSDGLMSACVRARSFLVSCECVPRRHVGSPGEAHQPGCPLRFVSEPAAGCEPWCEKAPGHTGNCRSFSGEPT